MESTLKNRLSELFLLEHTYKADTEATFKCLSNCKYDHIIEISCCIPVCSLYYFSPLAVENGGRFADGTDLE